MWDHIMKGDVRVSLNVPLLAGEFVSVMRLEKRDGNMGGGGNTIRYTTTSTVMEPQLNGAFAQ